MPVPPRDAAGSKASADVVRRQYLASAAGNFEALRDTLAPDVEWTHMADFPLGGTYCTPVGVTTQVVGRLAEEWVNWVAHDDASIMDGENVVVLARCTEASRSTGRSPPVRVAHQFIVRCGKAMRFEQFVDPASVREAM
jgi:uncharacterized protein